MIDFGSTFTKLTAVDTEKEDAADADCPLVLRRT